MTHLRVLLLQVKGCKFLEIETDIRYLETSKRNRKQIPQIFTDDIAMHETGLCAYSYTGYRNILLMRPFRAVTKANMSFTYLWRIHIDILLHSPCEHIVKQTGKENRQIHQCYFDTSLICNT